MAESISDRKLLSSGSVDQKLKAVTSRQRLASRIEDFNRQSSRYISTDQADEADDLVKEKTCDFEYDVDSSVDDELEHQSNIRPTDADLSSSTAVTPESMSFNLPSTLGRDKCDALGIKSLVRKELRLRRGQANDTLHQLRVELGYKAFIHRTTVRHANSQQKATRARSLVQASGTTITRLRHIYNCAWTAMVRLGASTHTLDHYKVITDADLRVSTAIQDPRVTNAADTALSWIWTVDTRKEMDYSDWMEECELAFLRYLLSFLIVLTNSYPMALWLGSNHIHGNIFIYHHIPVCCLLRPLSSPICHWHYPDTLSDPWPIPSPIRYSHLPDVISHPLSISSHFFHFTLCIVYRIHWLRAKARYDRSREDVCLLRHEMTWTINYFVHRSSSWQALSHGMDPMLQPGHISYASRQMSMWTAFADKARVVFSLLLESNPFPSSE